MTKYPTKNFTPTNVESSAFAWDQLADAVIGHDVGERTSPGRLKEALDLLSDDDLRLLNRILSFVPAITTGHLSYATQTAVGKRAAARRRANEMRP